MTDRADEASAPDRFFVCPTCGRWREEELERCPDDGARLRPARRPPGSLVGRELAGRFRIDGVLGEGAMGTVYRAVQQPIGRLVAVKVLRAELAADPAVVSRFHTEATAASALANPNTVTIYDFGQTEAGALYIAMEHLKGPTLADRLGRGPLPLAHALEIAAQICRALAEAHQKGIVHRDLEPDDVVLSTADDGSLLVKVVDFGIARVFRPSGGLPATGGPVTNDGAVIGTPRYLSPEQAQGQPPGPASDLYALGVILHEMIAGTPPFDDPQVPALSSPLGPVPEPARRLVGALLAKAPGDRPESAGAVGAALRALLDATSIPAAQVVEPPRAAIVDDHAPAAAPPGAGGTSPDRVTVPYAAPDPDDDEEERATAPLEEGGAAAPAPATLQTLEPVRRRRWVIPSMLLGLTVLVMGVGVVVVLTIGSGGQAAQSEDGPDAVEAVEPREGALAPGEAGAAPPPRPAADQEATVSVLLDSSPPGARVSSGAEFLCYTPCRTSLPAGERVTLRFRRQGYQVRTYQGELRDGEVVAVELEPSRGGE